eukprot:3507743-Pleurochrysis_carterae.AAC.5
MCDALPITALEMALLYVVKPFCKLKETQKREVPVIAQGTNQAISKCPDESVPLAAEAAASQVETTSKSSAAHSATKSEMWVSLPAAARNRKTTNLAKVILDPSNDVHAMRKNTCTMSMEYAPTEIVNCRNCQLVPERAAISHKVGLCCSAACWAQRSQWRRNPKRSVKCHAACMGQAAPRQ